MLGTTHVPLGIYEVRENDGVGAGWLTWEVTKMRMLPMNPFH
jgi:hypothetical protein